MVRLKEAVPPQPEPQSDQRVPSSRWLTIGLSILGVIVVIGCVGYFLRARGYPSSVNPDASRQLGFTQSGSATEQAGQKLAGGTCHGTGPGTLTKSAMDPDDFAMMIPYGLMVGGHVTPIDHMYYSPVYYNSPRDAYPVYAMGDATLVDIEHRTEQPQDNPHTRRTVTNEWRLVFSQSCTFYYYYDLLTSVNDQIKSAFEAAAQGRMSAQVNLPVKAGDRIGRIGGQTLDFAVWNTEKPLTGFIVPDHYNAEPWKRYVVDPLDYESAGLKALLLKKYPRTTAPLSGKLDWDVDGTLRGTWFEEGTNYLQGDGTNPKGNWAGHLAFAPNLYDNSRWIVSMGDYPVAQDANTQVSATQFTTKLGSPDPQTITPNSGLIKLELVRDSYVKADGSPWGVKDGFTQYPKLGTDGESRILATALVQLTDQRTLKFEVFPGKTVATVSDFDGNAKIYTR